MRLDITPISRKTELPCRVFGVRTIEAELGRSLTTPPSGNGGALLDAAEVDALEPKMRAAALATGERLLLGFFADPAVETSPHVFKGLYEPSASLHAGLQTDAARAGIKRRGLLPIARLNGTAMPSETASRAPDPSCWFNGLEIWMRTPYVADKVYAWDSHVAKGSNPHSFFHINGRSALAAFGHANHAHLGGAQLVQTRQLRYLQIDGRLFLVVGVVVDGTQLGEAMREHVDPDSIVAIGIHAVRSGVSWTLAWAAAKSGMSGALAAGIAQCPGVALCAVGGGVYPGIAGCHSADWIADFIEDL